MHDTTALVDRWVAGWAASRRMTAHREDSGWVVEVASDTRARERVGTVPPLPELRRRVAATTAPDVWLTLVGDLDAQTRDALTPLDRVTNEERMMTASLVPIARPAGVRLDEDGDVAHARVEVDGVVAARGQAAVHGTDAVFDRVETAPEFRRRGYGRLVMTGLAAWAAERGATTGLLFASVDGRALYRGLGWTEAAPIATFQGRGE